jgi:hypothetical protein
VFFWVLSALVFIYKGRHMISVDLHMCCLSLCSSHTCVLTQAARCHTHSRSLPQNSRCSGCSCLWSPPACSWVSSEWGPAALFETSMCTVQCMQHTAAGGTQPAPSVSVLRAQHAGALVAAPCQTQQQLQCRRRPPPS